MLQFAIALFFLLMSRFSRLSNHRTRALLILLIGLQWFAQLAAAGHGVSHLAEWLGGAASSTLSRTTGTTPATEGNGSNTPATGVHSCGLCLLAHDLAQGLQTPPALAFAQPQGFDLALAPRLPSRIGIRLIPQPRGPPAVS